jgi:hypothetical protein
MYKTGNSILTVRITVIQEIYKIFGDAVSGVSSNNILLLESRGDYAEFISSYHSDMAVLLDKLTFLGAVYIKPHPTHGISIFLESDAKVMFIDESTPAVMINLTDFAMIVGIQSAALKEVRHTKVVSVIDSFKFTNDAVKLNFNRYLKNDFRSEIQFKLIDQMTPECLIVQ